MSGARLKDVVRFHYTARLGEGTVVDSTSGREPAELTLGLQRAVPGMEKALLGMRHGERKTVTIVPEDGYGRRTEDLVVELDRSELPEGAKPSPGMFLRLSPEGLPGFKALITEVDDSTVTIDANHPLAGEELILEIELVEIVRGAEKGSSGPMQADWPSRVPDTEKKGI